MIKKAVELTPGDPTLMELGGRLMAMGGQLHEAKELTQKALDKATEQENGDLVTKVSILNPSQKVRKLFLLDYFGKCVEFCQLNFI